jgi:transposase
LSLSLSACVPVVSFFTGIDWAAESHAVAVLDHHGLAKAQFTIEHSAAGFAALIRRLTAFGEPAGMPVAIERPGGRLVDALLQAGHPVVPVKPNTIKAWRDGEVLSGAKSDPGDALVIAEYLRLRQHKLRVAVPYSAQTLALRTVTRTRGDLVDARVAAANQLSALLDSHWPGATAIFAKVHSPIALALLTRYPTAASAARVGKKQIAAFCARHGYSGRRTPAELLARLHLAPAGTTSDILSPAVHAAVLAQVGVLQALGAAIKETDNSIRACLGEHPDGKIFTSLPRSGQINAAQVLAEWGDCREAYDSPDARRRPRRPVPGHQGIRQAPSRQLPVGLQHPIPCRVHPVRRQQPARQPWAASIYYAARTAGKDHPHAIRVLAAPGSASCTAAGSTASPTTPPTTAQPPGSQPATRPPDCPPATPKPLGVDTEGVMPSHTIGASIPNRPVNRVRTPPPRIRDEGSRPVRWSARIRLAARSTSARSSFHGPRDRVRDPNLNASIRRTAGRYHQREPR